MSIIGNSKIEKIQFAENHVAPWTANSVAIGSSSAAVTAWSAQVTAARAAFNARLAAITAAENATNNLNDALDAMMASTASIIKQVRAKADLVGDSVYPLASLPVPKTPTPAGAPGKPFEFKAKLDDATGELLLTWKNNNATGCVYNIYRRVGDTGPFTNLGGVGEKRYNDSTVPSGATQLQYQIEAVRSTGVSGYALFVVNLGSGSGGTSVIEGTPVKMAA